MSPLRAKLIVGTVIASAVMFAVASPASAHVSFDKASAPAGAEVALQVRVPVEDFTDPQTNNAGVRVRLPASFDGVSCQAPVGWSCRIDQRADGGDNVVFTRESGTGPYDLLDFVAITPAQTGRYAIPVDQSKSNGDLVSWENGEDEDKPAPVLDVTPSGTAPQQRADDGTERHDEAPAAATAPPEPTLEQASSKGTTSTTSPPAAAVTPTPSTTVASQEPASTSQLASAPVGPASEASPTLLAASPVSTGPVRVDTVPLAAAVLVVGLAVAAALAHRGRARVTE